MPAVPAAATRRFDESFLETKVSPRLSTLSQEGFVVPIMQLYLKPVGTGLRPARALQPRPARLAVRCFGRCRHLQTLLYYSFCRRNEGARRSTCRTRLIPAGGTDHYRCRTPPPAALLPAGRCAASPCAVTAMTRLCRLSAEGRRRASHRHDAGQGQCSSCHSCCHLR